MENKNSKMKNYITYIVILIVGLLLGWVIFGGKSSTDDLDHNHQAVAGSSMWTCSMHPQVMQPESGDCPICGMDLIPTEASVDGLKANQFKMTENALALANVETTVIGEIEASANSLNLSGKIKINDKSSAVQTAHFGGRIESLFFKSIGELVNTGDVIASIYSPELVTAQNELMEALDIKNEQPELYEAVRNKLKFWKISEQQIQQIEQSKKVISNFNMYANTNGYIETIFVEEGNHVKEGAPLFKVANLNSVWASLDVYEKDIQHIKVGQLVTIQLNAFPDKDIEARIDYIDPILDDKTRTTEVRVTLKNTDNTLKPGMLLAGQVELEESTPQQSISVPKTSVMWTGKRSIVYVKVDGYQPIFEMREVNLGQELDESYEVLSGLKTGEEVVTNGTFTIDAAAQLLGKPSMMNASTTDTVDFNRNPIERSSAIEIEFDEEFENSFSKTIAAYLELKNAMVKSDASIATTKSDMFRKTLEEIPVKDREQSNHWSMMHKTSKGINNNVNIEHQRKQFQIISNAMIEMLMNFNKVENKLYIQYCPMANDDKGAYWLSQEEQIRNPYFGDVMLKCGSVEHVLENN